MRARLMCATALTALALSGPAAAQPAPGTGPSGGRVTAGQATIGTAPGRTTITQGSDRAVIDWQRFDVGRDHTVQFRQPSAQSWTLNRVQAGDPSTVAGRIRANGGVVITNPSGVVFSEGAQVNVGSLIASAPGITNEAFMAGRMRFDQPARAGARVANAGEVTVAEGGLAALVGPEVANSGRIRARLGRVVMGGAEAYALDLHGDGLIALDVTGQVQSRGGGAALVTNGGTIEAQGGTVLLAARAAGGVIETLVSQAGTIEVGTIGTGTGRAAIRAQGGDAVVSGRIGATGGTARRGGTVEVVASGTARLTPTARIDASGGAGGGRVVVGADARSRQRAPAGLGGGVAMAPGASIRADATRRGAGGEVILHSQTRTEALGTIAARGAGGGAGGQVEVSSRGQVLMGAAVDVSAPGGMAGSLLVDPLVLHVVDAFTGTGTGTGVSEILASTLSAEAGASLLEAQEAILVLAPINKRSGDLTLTTTGSVSSFDSGIFIDADINLPLGRFTATTPAGRFMLGGERSVSALGVTVNAGGIGVAGTLIATTLPLELIAAGSARDENLLNGGISITGMVNARDLRMVSGASFIHVGSAETLADAIDAIPSAAGLFDEALIYGVFPTTGASLRATRNLTLNAAREVYIDGALTAGASASGGSMSLAAGADMTLLGTLTVQGGLTAAATGALLHSGESVAQNSRADALDGYAVIMSGQAGLVNTGRVVSRGTRSSTIADGLPGVWLSSAFGAVRAGAIDSAGQVLIEGTEIRLDGPISGSLGPSTRGALQIFAKAGSVSVEVPIAVPGAEGLFVAEATGAFHLAGFGDSSGISANSIRISAGGIALTGGLSAGLPALGHRGGGGISLQALGALNSPTELDGSITIFNTVQTGPESPISLASTAGFTLLAPAAEAGPLLHDLGGPVAAALLRGDACAGPACARIASAGSGAIDLRAGGHLFNAGTIAGGGGIAIDAALLTNRGLIDGAAANTSDSATGLALVVGGALTNSGTLRGTGGEVGGVRSTMATPALSILVGGDLTQEATGLVEALSGTGRADAAGRLLLQAASRIGNEGTISAEGELTIQAQGEILNRATGRIVSSWTRATGNAGQSIEIATPGNLVNAGKIEAVGTGPNETSSIAIEVGGDLLNIGVLRTPARLRLGAGGTAALGGTLAAATLEVVAGSLRLDGTALDLTRSGWFAAPLITAGAPARLVDPAARPALIFDVRANPGIGFALPDQPGLADADQPMQLASFAPPVAGVGGTLSLNLEAGSAPLFLLLDGGTASGQLVAGRLGLVGRGGGAQLAGTVGGEAGAAAARRATLTAQDDVTIQARYLLNDCIIALATCAIPPPPPPPPPPPDPAPDPIAQILAEVQEQQAEEIDPPKILAATIVEAVARTTQVRTAPEPFRPPQRLVPSRIPRARLADPDLVLPLGLSEE